MSNERLRAALLQHGLTPDALAAEIGVDGKTVERWINGRTPYRRHQHAIAVQLGLQETYLWPPDTTNEEAIAADSEVVRIYARRSEVPREVWMRLFESAEQEIKILVYAGAFLANDVGIQQILQSRAADGVPVQVLLGDPDSEEVKQRSIDEGVEGAMSFEIRRALHSYAPLATTRNAEVRLHQTVLYNSLYIAGDQLLVNTHVYGVKAGQAPVWHLRTTESGSMTAAYLDSFEHVWASSAPLPNQ